MGGPQQQYSTAGNIRVLARVRPQLAHEYQYDHAVEVPSATQIKLQNTKQSYESSYDRVLPDTSSQEQVYAQVSTCIPSLLQGYNNTIFSYGQTGTGKTYTMIGDQSMTLAEACSAPNSTSKHGILSRAVHGLFTEMDWRKAAAASRGQEFDVKLVCSYLEIYNDRLYDLLQPYKKSSSRDLLRVQLSKNSLEVREDPVAGVHIPNLLSVDVNSCKQVLQLVATGNSNRATAHTDMNHHSSRSHAILQLWLEQRPSSQDSKAAGVVVRSKMNFVDLAGSERWGKAHTEAEGRTLINELTSINNSLSALAMVVSALTDKAAKHIPYRSSRLTHLLQDSLGGNCNTTLIVTVAPCVDAFEDSMAALKFADRTRNVANKAVVNSTHDTDTILALKEREIQRLRALLSSYTGVSAAGNSPVPAVQQQSGQFPPAMFDQDGLLRPSSHPGTASSLLSSSSTDSRRQLSHLSASDTSDARLTSTDSSSAGTDPADATAAADRMRLESELAAMRAALELERDMRSALEGQLQEAAAAAQAQQHAAAVAALQAQQHAAAAAARASTQQHVAGSNHSASNTGAYAPGVASVNAADGLIRTGRSSLLAFTAQTQPPVVLAGPAWPLLPGSPQQKHQRQQQHPSPKESSRGRSQQHMQHSDQVVKQQSPPKQKPAHWNDNWQGSVEQQIKASCSPHKQQNSDQGINRSKSNAALGVTPALERAQTPTGKVSSLTKSAYEARDRANPLRSSWSEAYGPSGGPTGKWPTSKSAGPATSRSIMSSSKVAGAMLASGSRTSRATDAVVRAGRKSLLQDQGTSELASNGVLQELLRSASSPNALKQAVSARRQISSIIAGPAVNSAGLLKQPQQQQSAHALPSRPAGSPQQQQQQQPVQQGWGRSWLLQQTQLQSNPSAAAAAPSVAASPAQPQAAAAAIVSKGAVPDLQRQEMTMSVHPGQAVQPAVIASTTMFSTQTQENVHMSQQPFENSDTADVNTCAALEAKCAALEAPVINDSNKVESYSDSLEDFESDNNSSLAQDVPHSEEEVQPAATASITMSSTQPPVHAHMPQQRSEDPGALNNDSSTALETSVIDESNKEECYSDSPEDFESDSNINLTQAEEPESSIEQSGPVDESSVIEQQQEQQQPQTQDSSGQDDGVDAVVHSQQLELSHHDPQPAEQQYSTEVLADQQQEAAGQQLDEAIEQQAGVLPLQQPSSAFQLPESQEQPSAQHLNWPQTQVQLAEPAGLQIAMQLGPAQQRPSTGQSQQLTAQPSDVPNAAADASYDDIEDELLLAEQESLAFIAKAIRRTRDL